MRTASARNRYRPYAINFTINFTVCFTVRGSCSAGHVPRHLRGPIRFPSSVSGRGASGPIRRSGYLTTVIRFAAGTGYGVATEELAVR